jgi:HK97 family phage portal protein
MSNRRKSKKKLKNHAVQKSWWTNLSGGYRGTYDAFGGQREPSKAELISAYDDIVYACVRLISSNIAKVPIKLYVKTAPGQRQPKCATMPVHEKMARHFRHKFFGTDIKEVVEHPLLRLLGQCNAFHNKRELLELTEIYLDLSGNAYWYLRFNGVGIPEELYLLPSQYVQPDRDENFFVRKWLFGQGMELREYSLDEIIHFKFANPADPYGEGVSPLRGAWGRHEISAKELSYLDNYLSNQGKPDAVLGIKDSISPIEAERVAKEFGQRFKGQGAGGILVLDGTMNLQPLNFPAKDLAELQLYSTLKTVICNAFSIPPDIFELGTSSNRSTREAALYALAAQCLQPRLDGIVQKLNDRLVPYFDDRLFFEADCIVPEDKDYDLQLEDMLLRNGAMLRQEARVRHNLEPQGWAAEPLLPSGVLPVSATVQPEEPEEVLPVEQPVDRTQQAAAVQQLQQAYYSGQLPRGAVLAQATIIHGFSQEEAEALFPPAEPKPQQPEQPPEQEQHQGGDEQPPEQQPQPKAVEKAPEIIPVPDYRQSGNYDCGAAATHAVCAYFGVGERTEEDFIEALDTTPEGGTEPRHILTYLEQVGLSALPRDGMSLQDVAESVDHGCPVIVCFQDYGTPEEEARDESGHYVVVIGIDDQRVYLQDPSAGRVEMPLEQFESNWHDEDDQGNKYVCYGISVCGGSTKAGSVEECVQHKIPILMNEGYSQDQAIAIAYHYCGEKGKKGCGCKEKAVVHNKALRQKSPLKMIETLQGFFRKMMDETIGRVKALDDVQKKAAPAEWFDPDYWTYQMMHAMRPVMQLYFDYGAKETVSHLDLSPAMFHTVQPKLKEGVDKAVMVFCGETVATTRLELDAAVDALRKEITEGLIEGDVKNAMMQRVQKVFEDAENYRAFRIGVTEASRGQHAAQEITASESGVVKGKTWLLSNDACPICKPLSGKTVALGENFTVDGSGPYAEIPYPPRHPNCRCTLLLETGE